MVYGEDIKINVPESIKQGTNEAVSTMTKYAIITASVLIASKIILDKKSIEKIRTRFLGV